MCRHAAYMGPPVPIDTLTHRFDHDLEHQSYEARELLTGVVCADGFGVTWYDAAVRPEPARYASAMPIWNDVNMRSMGPVVHAECIMAAVRNATVPGSTHEANSAPFVNGRYCFSLNGFLEDFDASWKPWILEQISPEHQQRIHGSTDGEFIFHAVLTRVGEGEDLPSALQGLVRDLCNRGTASGKEAQLNILLSDGERLLATRAGTAGRSNSLYILRDGDELPGSVVVASEPIMDDAQWQAVGDDVILVLQPDAPSVTLQV